MDTCKCSSMKLIFGQKLLVTILRPCGMIFNAFCAASLRISAKTFIKKNP